MVELELVRSSDSRRVYEIAGIGTLSFEGRFSRRATAESGAVRWSLSRRGIWKTTIEALDTTGTAVGSFSPRSLRRGAPVRWAGAQFQLRVESRWKRHYVLADGGRDVAVLAGGGRSRRPVRISIEDPGSVDPGLLLFLAYTVRQMADDAGAAAAGASVAATGG